MANSNSTSFPILTTERLTIRQLSIDDQHDIFALRSDTEINKYLDRE
ncbi:MAG: N-acetyltransferase, partial [Flavobacterium sp.]